jgi:hypothetical protein
MNIYNSLMKWNLTTQCINIGGLFFFFFETRSCYVAQAGLLLSQTPKFPLFIVTLGFPFAS